MYDGIWPTYSNELFPPRSQSELLDSIENCLLFSFEWPRKKLKKKKKIHEVV